GSRSRRRKWVTASRPASRTAMRMRSRGWRSIGASAVPPDTSAPTTTARYWRCTSRADSWATKAVCACSVRATTITPDVSLSRRCTMPARGTAASAGSRNSRALTRVPLWLPAPGCTTRPAGLSMTRTSASSCSTVSGMSSGSARTWVSRVAVSRISWPPRTDSRGRTVAPSSRTSPDFTQAASREREYSGNSSASTASKRRPAMASGTCAPLGAPRAASPASWASSCWSVRGVGSDSVVAAGWAGLAAIIPASRPPRPGRPMTRRATLFRSALLLVFLAMFAASGCARMKNMLKDDDVDEGVAVEALYDKGHALMRGGNWAGASTTYRRLTAQYPYGPYTEQALMEIAYAQYKMGRHDDAVSSIDRFIRTYPTHRNVAYMYYLRGLVNSTRDTVFLQRAWNLDASRRDLATPLHGYNDLPIVTAR